MKFRDLLCELNVNPLSYKGFEDKTVRGIADNSNDVKDGYIFIAIKGHQADGHDYIQNAIRKGVSLIIGEKEIGDLPVPYIKTDNSRKALGVISKKYYQNPSKDKIMIGITGTNGKTTTSYVLKHIVEQCGKTCAIIGTIQNTINGKTLPSGNTTPSVLMINQLLSVSTDDVVIMEVSSHGLTQCRVEGVEFDIGIFTNLYHEHLDYHRTMDEYFQAKLLLYNHLKKNGVAIINRDNEWGEKLAAILIERKIPVFSIGEDQDNDVQLLDFLATTSTIKAKENDTAFEVACPIPGIHNMYNTMMAYLTARHINISRPLVQQAILSFTGVDGRFEQYKSDHMPTVIVDYAHTPDAIFHCIASAKTYGAKRIIHVFGFRGNRDKTKRPQMVSISAKYSDIYILTLDDLNGIPENEMVKTLEDLHHKFGNQKGVIIPDRTVAIQRAMEFANDGDWVIITGKGHESYKQNFSLHTHSDKETVELLLEPSKVQEITN